MTNSSRKFGLTYTLCLALLFLIPQFVKAEPVQKQMVSMKGTQLAHYHRDYHRPYWYRYGYRPGYMRQHYFWNNAWRNPYYYGPQCQQRCFIGWNNRVRCVQRCY